MTPHSSDTAAVEAIVASILQDEGTHRTSATSTPDAAIVESLVDRFHGLAFPGFFGPRFDPSDAVSMVGAVVDDVVERLRPQVAAAFAYEAVDGGGLSPEEARVRSVEVVRDFVAAIPAIRGMLGRDARAGFTRDPAVGHPDEAILCHPGLRALTVHRFAHQLHASGVPMLPRMLAEVSHARTGIDLHPGASIGGGFFIDHGTGVVVGETTVIGEDCTLYQGVTLGAKRFEREADGAIRRGYRRHPTLEDEVTVYAGATILGGKTVVGRGSVVSGGVFLTRSVPPNSLVAPPRLEIELRQR